MDYQLGDTIAAIATAGGGAARGMIRVAGPDALDCLAGMFMPHDPESQPALLRVATVVPGSVRIDELSGLALDCDLFVWPTARSYTRTPLVELHLIGSPPVLQALLAAICQTGARGAAAGEFTLRAFLAGRIDLTQAEAVLGVIDADGEHDLQVALTQLAGGLSGPLVAIRDQLLDLLAHLEAGLDFVEEDIEFISVEELTSQLTACIEQVEHVGGQLEQRAESVEAVQVVLIGDPNVGKSSLYNALIRHVQQNDLPQLVEAIVSPVAGTTRDYLATRCRIAGRTCELIDTAGLESPDSSGEQSTAASIATVVQQGTADRTRQASLKLLCLDGSRQLTERESDRLSMIDDDTLVIVTKADLPQVLASSLPAIVTSSSDAQGVAALWQAIRERIESQESNAGSGVLATAARCGESIRRALGSLTTARELAGSGSQEELVASELRVALNELGQVVGAVYTDDVLDRVFSRFCIGK